MRRLSPALPLLLTFILIIPCTAQKRPDSAGWRQDNNRGNRYEGFVALPAGNRFELLSFIAFLEKPQRSANLRVRFYRPFPYQVTIRARELRSKETDSYYWMESKPEGIQGGVPDWNLFGPWETGFVIDPGGIDLSAIGIAVYLGKADCSSCIVSPASVYHTAQPPPPSEYVIWARPDTQMYSIDWSLYRVVEGKEVFAKQDRLGPRGSDTPFRIALDVAGFPEGLMRLYVKGRVNSASEAKTGLQLSFFHKVR